MINIIKSFSEEIALLSTLIFIIWHSSFFLYAVIKKKRIINLFKSYNRNTYNIYLTVSIVLFIIMLFSYYFVFTKPL